MVFVRSHVWVTGRVQGVFFRGSCAREAERAGVRGWVKNLPDGRVEAVFEGPPETVARLVAWCRHGPPGALVTHLEVKEEPPRNEPDFRIEH